MTTSDRSATHSAPRGDVLRVLRTASEPMDVATLAVMVGSHPNTCREHLARLLEDGLVTRTPDHTGRRGRPSWRYLATPAARAVTTSPTTGSGALARALVDHLGAMPDATTQAVDAGRRWARTLQPTDGRPGDLPIGPIDGRPGEPPTQPTDGRPGEPPTELLTDPTDGRPEVPTALADGPTLPSADHPTPMARLLALFEEAGFAPEAPTRPGDPIGLRACPFGLLPRDGSRAVCNVHRGLIAGVLEGLGAPADGVVLEPFVRPDLCLAHVGALGRG